MKKMLKYRRMLADNLPPGRPILLLRAQNYNVVSLGALLGACPEEILARVEVVLWEKNQPAPDLPPGHPTLRAYSFMMLHAEKVSLEIAALRRDYPVGGKHFFVAGGALASTDPEAVNALGFDLVVSGEGEEIFPRILVDWLSGKIATGICHAGPAWIDLDKFPGFHPTVGYLPPIEISRGCKFGCNFCSVPRLFRGTLRHRSVSRIVEIARSYREISPGRRRVKFLASNAFAYGSAGREPNPKALFELLSAIRAAGYPQICLGSFPSEIRPDFVIPEVLDVVRPFLTNEVIVIGVQSGIDERLEVMHRGHTREQAVKALELLKKYDFTPHVDFILGTPGEKASDQRATVEFMEELVERFGILIHMHTFMALPGAVWKDKTPRSIIPEVHERLRALSNKGVLDGWWENQIGYGRRKSRA